MKLPEDYIESMRQLLGEEELQNYLDCFDAPRTYGLRVNTGKISVETFLKRTPFHLTPVPWVENGFYYDPEEGVTKHPDYYAGLYYIQEPSAMVPASRLPIEEGDRVLDLSRLPVENPRSWLQGFGGRGFWCQTISAVPERRAF